LNKDAKGHDELHGQSSVAVAAFTVAHPIAGSATIETRAMTCKTFFFIRFLLFCAVRRGDDRIHG
jgi:hypothetical protein